MIYNEIYNFCKVKNKGNCYKNGEEITPRVKFLIELLDREGIPYQIDSWEIKNSYHSFFDDDDYIDWREEMSKRYSRFGNRNRIIGVSSSITPFVEEEPLFLKPPVQKKKEEKNILYNIVLRGTSDKMVIAHHDIQNPNSDNANDNSCSVINAIAVKKLKPETNVILLDGEEMGQIGANRLGKQIKEGKFGSIQWVLNLELTGKGGKNFFVGNYPGPLTDKIVAEFQCPIVSTPVNDALGIRINGIDSTVINPLPILPEGETSRVKTKDGKYLDINMLGHCHSMSDSLDTIDPKDMQEFVEEVVLKILNF